MSELKIKLDLDTEFDKGTDEEMQVLKNLRNGLEELDIGEVKFGSKKSSDTKSVGGIDWNEIIVTAFAVGIPAVAKTIHAWLNYKKGRKAKINGNTFEGFSGSEILDIQKTLESSNRNSTK